jgi:Glycosyl hydrolases family 2, sugar binding domain/Glycosyl hydrolases family 2, TIM barrel domain/Glycosyl hydrolases family 2
MPRVRISLNGPWEFVPDPNDAYQPDTLPGMRSITVPGGWENQFPGKAGTFGRAWYRKRFGVPAEWSSRTVFLHFGAVNYHTEVWVNGTSVGEHEGGYTPFYFRIDPHLRPDEENTLVVKVVHPAYAIPSFPDFSYREVATTLPSLFGYELGEIPLGKQNWYGTVSGIWQDVHLDVVYPVFFTRVLVSPNVDSRCACVRVGVNAPPGDGGGLTLHYRVLDADGAPVGDRSEIALAQALAGNAMPERALTSPYVDVPLEALRLWDLPDPHLYQLAVSLTKGGEEVDDATVRFGMRKVEARDNLIFLNNRPVYIMGALDQDFYPETSYTPPSDDFLVDQVRKAKHMGLNMLRCHIKAPDPRYLDAADRAGMLVWEELPNWLRLTEKAAARGRETLTRMIERDFNHPSVIIWTIINEGWGVDLVNREFDRRWLKQMYSYVKKTDPTRLVVDNSPCNMPQGRNFHLRTDIEDFHIYFAIPDHFHKWADWVKDFSTHPSWTFSYNGDAERTGQEPLMVSEFGNWGLPTLKDLLTDYGEEPSWFKTGTDETQPHGVQRRFTRFHLDRVFGSYDQFAIASQWQQYHALKYQIEEMRKYRSLVGYVITEFTDLHWEANGLLNIWRRPKVFYNYLAQFQQQDIVFAGWQRLNYWEGDLCNVDVHVSHFSDREMGAYTVEWNISDLGVSGVIPDVSLAVGEARPVGTVSFLVPPLSDSVRSRLHLRLKDASGKIVARNRQYLSFFPRAYFRPAPSAAPLWVHDPLALWDLETRLRDAGYPVVTDPEAGEVRPAHAIVCRIDEHVAAFIRGGGKVLFLVHSQDDIPATLPERELIRIRNRRARLDEKTRDRNPWEGDWVTNWNWLKHDTLFDRIPRTLDSPFPGELMDFQYYKVIPNHVLTGWSQDRDFEDIFAGIVVGWVHSPASLIAQCRWGAGALLATTLKLESAFGDDPVATILLQNLIRHLFSSRFAPTKNLHARRARAGAPAEEPAPAG